MAPVQKRLALAVLVGILLAMVSWQAAVRADSARKFALVIGIGPGYQNPAFRTLQHPERDARLMAAALKQLGFEIVAEVAGTAATGQGIKHGINKLAQSADHPDDLVVVYFSGHGAIQRANGRDIPSLVPSDADPRQASSYITDTELGQWLAFIKSRKVMLILDSCYSAGLGEVEKRITAPQQMSDQDVQRRLQRIKQAEFVGALFQSTFILASSQARETSKETDKGGLFTYYLLLGMGNPARGSCPACEEGTNYLTPGSWLQWVGKGVTASADQEPQLRTPPQADRLALLVPWAKPLPAPARPTAMPPTPAATPVPVPSPPPAPGGAIVLKLNVSGADIAVDGTAVLAGVGPEVRLGDRRAGTYAVTVSKAGYLPRTLKVQVHGNEQVRVVVNLAQPPAARGSLSLISSPPGARIVIGGKNYKTPVGKLTLKPGPYTVKINLKGYHHLAEQVQVDANQHHRYTFLLTPVQRPIAVVTIANAPAPRRTGEILGTYSVGAKPQHVAIDAAGNVWVTNWGNHTVMRLSPGGAAQGVFSLGAPDAVAVDADGNAWITSSSANTVTRFSPTGDLLGVTGVESSPGSIAIDGVRGVWVTNSDNNTVTRLSPSGGVLGVFKVAQNPRALAVDAAGTLWVASRAGTVTRFSPDGTVIGSSSIAGGPESIAIDAAGNAWVALLLGNSVAKFSPTGELLGTFPAGKGPVSVAIDTAGKVWVANQNSHDVTNLSAQGAILGSYKVGNTPRSIRIDPGGNIWVVNRGSDSLMKLAP